MFKTFIDINSYCSQAPVNVTAYAPKLYWLMTNQLSDSS